MAEIRESIRKNGIPANWSFPERGNPSLRIRAFNVGERSLSGGLDSGEEFDYFFDNNGSPVEARHFGNPNKNSEIIFFTEHSIEKYIFAAPKKLTEPSKRGKPKTRLTVEFSYQYRDEGVRGDSDKVEFLEKGELGRIILARTMVKDGEPIGASPITVNSIEGKSGFVPEEWNVALSEPTDFVSSEYDKHLFINSQGEEVAIAIKVESEKGPRKDQFILKIIETQLPDEAIKVVQAPLSVDIKAIENVAFSTQNEEEVPWRNIGQLIGARVYYTQQYKA